VNSIAQPVSAGIVHVNSITQPVSAAVLQLNSKDHDLFLFKQVGKKPGIYINVVVHVSP
jgi:hypothetical protein